MDIPSLSANRRLPYLLLTIGTFFWGTNFILGRFLASDVPPFTMCAGRFTVAAVIFAVMALRYRWPVPRGRQWIYIVAMAFTGVFLFNTLLYWGLSYTTAINGTLVNGFNPLVTVVMAVILLREKAGRRLWVGVLVSVIGVFLIAARGNADVLVHLNLNRGDLLILLGTVVWGLYTIFVRILTRDFPVLPATAYATWLGVLMLYPAVYQEVQQMPPKITGGVIGTFIYLGIFASVVAFICWNWSVSKIGATKATVFYNLIPLYGAVLSPLFLNEQLYLLHLFGGILIVGGVMMGIWHPAPPADVPAAKEMDPGTVKE